jgi:tetratricopeptide (TPR) repeat protein
MDNHLLNQIYNNLLLKETEDLLEIWQKNDSNEWNEKVFEIVKEILVERLGYIPDTSVQKQVSQILRNVDNLILNGEFDKSLAECDTAIKMLPEHAIAYSYRANIYNELGQLENAIKNYQTALQLEPELKDAWKNMQRIEENLEEIFQNSIAKQHLDQAIVLAYSDQPEKAIEECKHAGLSLPEIAPAYNFLGMVLQELNQLESAIDSYLKAILLNPRFYAARENLRNARIYLEEEQYRQASTIYEFDGQEENEISNIEIDELQLVEWEEIDNLIPGWYYLDEKAFTLVGWPGHRTLPGKSGYDPLETDFEQAHMTGLIIRLLITGKFRTKNPIYLLFMTFLGLFFCLPLITVPVLIYGESNSILPLILFSPYIIIGIAIYVNVILSLWCVKSEQKSENTITFY